MASEILGTIGFFTTLMVLGVIFLKNRHRERLALIQYGKDSSVFHGKDRKNNTLKFGLLFMSVGAGLLVGIFLDKVFDSQPACTFACIFIFGGFSLIYYHQYLNGRIGSYDSGKDDFKDNDDLI
ncbi:MAG TPA: hypothetical protein PLQ57_15910 [Saprospiraceae bacterium]|jgi:hypothetical protein|nr:hypothetical protein [Saprospiraceae bacterium]HMS99066.1 hypothetical protein [Saprospiraceae bacterium]HRG22526.1 hypothetical protein [Saprospiraceae bacterium]HRG65758.1 hypothetical protein [Saprospiraceae bacterium]